MSRPTDATHTLRLTDDDLITIDRALQDAPFRIAAPLIQKINAQLAEARELPANPDDMTGT